MCPDDGLALRGHTFTHGATVSNETYDRSSFSFVASAATPGSAGAVSVVLICLVGIDPPTAGPS